MTAPLFALAAAWDRLRIGQRRWLRGTGVRAGPLRLHTHSVISGLIFTGLGAVFLRYQGTAGPDRIAVPAQPGRLGQPAAGRGHGNPGTRPRPGVHRRGGGRGDRRHGLAAPPNPARGLHRPAVTCRGASLGRARDE